MGLFQEGQSGNPKGRPKKLAKNSILLSKISEKLEDKDCAIINQILDTLINLAIDGDIKAIDLLFNRYAGAPPKAKDTEDDTKMHVTVSFEAAPDGDADGLDRDIFDEEL